MESSERGSSHGMREPDSIADLEAPRKHHGKFYSFVKRGIQMSGDFFNMALHDDDIDPTHTLSPVEKHIARINKLMHNKDPEDPPETHTIHSFSDLVSKAMTIAQDEVPETQNRSPSSIKTTKTGAALKAELGAAKRLSRTIVHLSKVTHFNESEIAGLIKMFQAFTSRSKVQGQMDRQLFRDVFQIHFGIMDDLMLDHMFHYFDEDRLGYITDNQWVLNLSTILRGTIQEQIEFCYEVYKLGSGPTSRDDVGIMRPQVRQMLQQCFYGDTSSKEGDDSTNNNELVDLLLRRLAKPTAGYIDLESFTNAVVANPLSIQSLGNCLPDLKRLQTFLALFAEDYNHFRCNYSLPNDLSYKGKKFFVMLRKRKT